MAFITLNTLTKDGKDFIKPKVFDSKNITGEMKVVPEGTSFHYGEFINVAVVVSTYVVSETLAEIIAMLPLEPGVVPTIQQVLTAGQVATTTIQTTGFIKTGGTAAQFLKADGSVDSSTYITSAALAPYFLTASFTDVAVTSKLITGYVSGAGVVAATDTILQAINKLNGNIGAIVSGVSSVNSLTGAVALTGTANRLTVSAANVFDISATFEALLGKVANPLSQFAATTSAQLFGIISDETGGSGVLVGSISPVFGTDITTPLIIGGTAVGSTIQYKGTSGNGTSTVAAHQFLVGNNGATTAASIYNDGNINIGNGAKNTSALSNLRVGLGTSIIDFGEVSSAVSGIWFTTSAKSTSNYAIQGDATETYFNAPSGTLRLRVANSDKIIFTTTKTTFNNGAGTSGAIVGWEFISNTNTGQTLSTNIPNFKVTGSNKQFATGTNALQYFNWFTTNTTAAVGASNFTVVGNLVVDYVQGGTNAVNVTSAAIYVPTLALTNTTTAYGISVQMPSGATNNHGIQITNGSIPLQGIVLTAQVGTAAVGAMYIGVTPSSSNHVLKSDGTSLQIQAPGASSVSISAANNGICTFTTSAITPAVNLAFNNGINVSFATTGGTKIGTATNQLFGFWNATPIVQPANTVAIDTLLVNVGFRASGGVSNFDNRVVLNLPTTLKGYTVSTLPAGNTGDVCYVTDALAPSYLASVVGGGVIVTPVFYNGSNWVAS